MHLKEPERQEQHVFFCGILALPSIIYLAVYGTGTILIRLGFDLSLSISWTYATAAMFVAGLVSVLTTPILFAAVWWEGTRIYRTLAVIACAAAALGTLHFLGAYGLIFMKG